MAAGKSPTLSPKINIMADDIFLKPTGDYKTLRAFQVAECIYDITYYFAKKYLY